MVLVPPCRRSPAVARLRRRRDPRRRTAGGRSTVPARRGALALVSPMGRGSPQGDGPSGSRPVRSSSAARSHGFWRAAGGERRRRVAHEPLDRRDDRGRLLGRGARGRRCVSCGRRFGTRQRRWPRLWRPPSRAMPELPVLDHDAVLGGGLAAGGDRARARGVRAPPPRRVGDAAEGLPRGRRRTATSARCRRAAAGWRCSSGSPRSRATRRRGLPTVMGVICLSRRARPASRWRCSTRAR